MHSIPSGFRFAGVSAGIKTRKDAKDISLIVSEFESSGAGVYTTNQVVAAPVVWCRQRTPSESLRAIVVNSGNANACTGKQGDLDAAEMANSVSRAIGGRSADQVLVMSTGVIGRPMPMEKVRSGIALAAQQLAANESGFLDAADGIRTTDAFRKITTRQVTLNGHRYAIAGMAKGAGMIGPRMATMLGCVLTDAPLNGQQARRLLQKAVSRSFNCISVEGHMSTNDTVLLLANGLGHGHPPMDDQGELAFSDHLTQMCVELAKQIPDDGEGATHLIEIRILGSQSIEDADQIARNVALSNLVKTAITGGDPNWGRIVSAAGYAGVIINPQHLSLKLNGFRLFERGEPLAFDAKEVSQSIKASKLTEIELVVGTGRESATHWTSDLNCEYVRFNSEYTT